METAVINSDARWKDYVLPNGKLHVSYASAQDGLALFSAATKLMRDNKIDKNTKDSELFIILNSDETVKSLVMERCAQCASYEGQKVNLALFDNRAIGNRACKDYANIFTSIFLWNFGRFSSGSSA